MPNSIRENNADVRAFVITHPEVLEVLDVGPGEGTYHRLIGDLVDMDAVEIWEKNITDFSLKNKYREVFHSDIRDFPYPEADGYDLVIFGDVLEHMPVVDAVKVFEDALSMSNWVLVSVPMVHFPQGAIDGNEHEFHEIEDPQTELIPLLGKPLYWWRYQITGTFIYQGKLEKRHENVSYDS